MPVYEYRCVTPGCPEEGKVKERFSPRYEDADPPCAVCGSRTERLISLAHPVFTGTISGKYLRRHDNEEAQMGGHWAWRRRSSRTGKPEKVWIETWQQQAKFCKEEGLYNPRELPPEGGEV